ncbi:LodA/GoxA family CTQ-dependent oxidase [Mucilaginibacter sp. KACC 22063]|uniref:LodA/GoxA family CTQ-dependent oxidase n=1 Tax=Mucilaginibacter sp. KACC 22063 TaxID=3025666 RepID=UPI0023660390|nr:LodA/GoxA family CTQ-dependent oxidase [Mucilaginibacter sp. KACC 22063]WDF54204.1 LodA/GoxA family CTQ-dependent oxidase [Mucilaginibacter sp. KACC 22063]
MANQINPRFRIYPSIGVARLGNGPAQQDQVTFSPDIPWENLYKTDENYLTETGQIRKQAQRFYIYECDESGRPFKQVDPAQYTIKWTAEVANKKPFWYDFNNSLDLSIISENRNLSPEFAINKIAPGIGATQRNPNVLDMSIRMPGGYDYRKELVNRPDAVTVDEVNNRQVLEGEFPFKKGGVSKLAASIDTTDKTVNLGTVEYDNGTLIFYAADGISAALNPSDLNTDFADNSNWYDDICDGRITAVITSKADGATYELTDANSAAWVTTAPPDYAPQINPISTMYDIISGASEDEFQSEFSLVFPLMYRLYRMQWVNLGDFLAPSFKETVDKLTADGKFKYLYQNTPEAKPVREQVFNLFRDPAYPYNNEPVIPSSSTTSISNRGSGLDELKLPYYPGDGINYPGSPAQWFAIPPLLYDKMRQWKDGDFAPVGEGITFNDIDELGEYYRQKFLEAATDPSKKPLLMTRAVLETLYGGGFHPGVELTWPMRHNLIYAENKEIFEKVAAKEGLFGLREIRINAATPAEQKEIFFNDFGFQMDSEDIRKTMDTTGGKHWLWKITPGDLTKWMGIPWQSDAGSCQAVFIEKQYPVPAWWAANLPVHVLPEASYLKILDPNILPDTKRNIFAGRLPWLQTTNTGFEGYHAEGGYMNGLISMVYQWKKIGMVAGRKVSPRVDGIPETVYVAFNGKGTDD